MRDIYMQPTCFTFICYFPGDFKHPFVLCGCSGPSVHKHLFKFRTCIFKTSVKTVSSSHSHNFHCLSSQIRSRTLVVFSELRARYEYPNLGHVAIIRMQPPPPPPTSCIFSLFIMRSFFSFRYVTVLLRITYLIYIWRKRQLNYYFFWLVKIFDEYARPL